MDTHNAVYSQVKICNKKGPRFGEPIEGRGSALIKKKKKR